MGEDCHQCYDTGHIVTKSSGNSIAMKTHRY